jgi:hypothetical protein
MLRAAPRASQRLHAAEARVSELELSLSRSLARVGALQRRCELLQDSAQQEAALRATADEALRRARADVERERAARLAAADEMRVLTAALAARNELLVHLEGEVERLRARESVLPPANVSAAAGSVMHHTPPRDAAGVGSGAVDGVPAEGGDVARDSPASYRASIPSLGAAKPRRAAVQHVAPADAHSPAWRIHQTVSPPAGAITGAASAAPPRRPALPSPPSPPAPPLHGATARHGPVHLPPPFDAPPSAGWMPLDDTDGSDASAVYREQARLADAIAETELLLAESKARMFALATTAYHGRTQGGQREHAVAHRPAAHALGRDNPGHAESESRGRFALPADASVTGEVGGACDATTISRATSSEE